MSRFFSFLKKKTTTTTTNQENNFLKNENENIDDFIKEVRNLNEPGLENEILKFENFVKKERENLPPRKILPKEQRGLFVPEQNEELFKELFLNKK